MNAKLPPFKTLITSRVEKLTKVFRIQPSSIGLLIISLFWLYHHNTQVFAVADSTESIVNQASSINLKSILEHQEALAKDCEEIHKESIEKLAYLIKFNDDNDLVQLPQPLSIKVPAICLFLFNHFNRAKLSNHQSEPPKRLELVNWLYNEDEIRQLNNGSISKRQVTNSNPMLDQSSATNLLNQYLFDPLEAFNETQTKEIDDSSNDIDDELQNYINTIVTDERFKGMINAKKKLIGQHLSPVILIPGLLGSRLQAKTNKINRVNIFCSKQSDWQDMWLSIRQLLPLAVDCWLDNVRLEYNPATGWSKQPKGIEVRVADFGSVESVRYLDIKQPALTGYFSDIIDQYEQLGYTADENLLAAPYDFRLAPQELTEYFIKLKKMIENAQDNSVYKKKVTLLCHSMGCTHLLVFLRLQSTAWRQSRIRKLIALSSPWGGAIKALKALVVGDQMDLPLISESKIRKLARNFPSMAFLLPQAEVFGRPSKDNPEIGGKLLVKTPEKDYYVDDIDQLLKDLNLNLQLEWFKSSTALIKPLEPLVDLHVDCIHSLNTPTSETLVFRNQSAFPDGDYELIKGNGDGTVNFESLMVCQDWASQLPDKVKHKIVMNTNHNGVLRNKVVLSHIINDVLINKP